MPPAPGSPAWNRSPYLQQEEDLMGDGKTKKTASLLRDYFKGEPPVKVLVSFGSQVPSGVTPSSYTPMAKPVDQANLKLLKDIAGVDPASVFTPSAPAGPPSLYQPASMMSLGPDPYLQNFYEVPATNHDQAVQLATEIKTKMSNVVTEVIPVPAAVPALGPASAVPSGGDRPTPDLRSLQGYLGPGPDGCNVYFAWQFPGGDGQGVTVVDIEGGWRLSHECLANVRFNLWAGEVSDTPAWIEHGTAVAGMLASPREGEGISGISPAARVGMVSIFEKGDASDQRIANTIFKAMDLVNPGDVMLLELQRPGPATNFQPDENQKGYLPLSYWPDIRAAISRVVAKGVCVIEVGGNGGEDLDSPTYEGRFDQSKVDSGSIMVGAGAPPGNAFGAPRSRLDFSNYGRRLDCQAWGQVVTTAGFGDLWGGPDNPNRAYTGQFMGTSSAAPIIAGIVACLQGRHRLVHGVPIPPANVRTALNVCGWPQAVVPNISANQHIGAQPDLVALFNFFGLMG
jgi:hypothetical protein